jgi:hypothetical protein|tara:strand:+ start:294 stop:686 length:393 start_codon:yes stop_codon:yes gene_type:complete
VSGEANGLTVDLKAAIERDHIGDVGVPAGAELLAFTNAVELDHDDIDATRTALADVIGRQATLEAAAIIAIFNGLVRVADGTGIQLDQGVFTASIEERDLLGINEFAGAANSTNVVAVNAQPMAVHDLFG